MVNTTMVLQINWFVAISYNSNRCQHKININYVPFGGDDRLLGMGSGSGITTKSGFSSSVLLASA